MCLTPFLTSRKGKREGVPFLEVPVYVIKHPTSGFEVLADTSLDLSTQLLQQHGFETLEDVVVI